MLVELDGLPISINKAYATNFKTRRRFKTKEYAEFEKKIKHADYFELFEITPKTKLEVNIYLIANWFTKSGKIRVIDAANYEKTLIDCISKHLGFDDSQIFKLSIHKRKSVLMTDRTRVYVYEIQE